MRSDFSFNTAIDFDPNDHGSRRSRRQRLNVWTIAVVSAMLSGVVGACVAYMPSCVLLALRCVSPSRCCFLHAARF